MDVTAKPNLRVSIPESVLARDLGEEMVLLDLASESYFGLDAVGSRLWHLLCETGSVKDACTRMLEEYDVSRDVLETDVVQWVDALLEAGLVRIEADE